MIAGAAGFIGSHLAKDFVGKKSEVVFLASSKLKLNSEESVLSLNEIEVRVKNGELKFDIVVNALQKYSREKSILNPYDMYIANVEIPKRLTAIALSCNSEFWHFSSYLEHTEIETEYVSQKREISKWLINSDKQLKIKNFTLGDTFGPLDSRDKILNIIKASAFGDTKIQLSSPNKGIRLLHIEDLLFNISKVQSFGRFCFLNPEMIFMREIMELLSKHQNKDMRVEWENTDDNTAEMEMIYRRVKQVSAPFDLILPLNTSQRVLDFLITD